MATMECSRKAIRLSAQPSPQPVHRRYVRIYSKRSRNVLSPPQSSTHSRRGNIPSRSTTPGKMPRQDLPNLSDVPCYTCRRRHVKCDKLLPHCAKCAKKGVSCLGYQKPLRWANGVAVRGRLKGKSQPVVDSHAVSLARIAFEDASASIWREAAHFGLHATDNCCSNVVSNDASLLELVNYHNSRISIKHLGSEVSQHVVPQIATLSPEAVQTLPRDLLNCILATAAVHMAVRHPGNRPLEQLALETKVNLFQGINRLFQDPQSQRADLLLCCVCLMFVMDAMENGNDRWNVHFAGAMKVLASSGGIDNFASHYPHMKRMLTKAVHFETMHVLLEPVPTDYPKLASRTALETLCFDPEVRKTFFVTCPLRLMEAVYDMGVCAQNIFRAHGIPSAADFYKREWILSNVLQFRPEEGTQIVRDNYYSHGELELELQVWNLVFSAWRSAITLVILRHLYFGLPNPELPSYPSQSPTPSVSDPEASHSARSDEPSYSFEDFDELDAGYSLEERLEPDRLSSGLRLADAISRTPSPLFSSNFATDNVSLYTWDRLYDIHNEAFTELSSNFLALTKNSNSQYLRYAIMPLMMFALVTRPNSPERALCFRCFDRFKAHMSDAAVPGSENAMPSPVGGSKLEFDIPWDKLDAYSEEIERERQESMVLGDNQLWGSAPEWNWWYMLKRVGLKTCWTLTAGTTFMELGAEFWPFSVMSGLLTDDCFAAFMQPPSTSPASSSS